MDEQSGDYGVGYGKPPVEGRFEKGKSGNPGGRPRRTKSLASLLGEALSQRSRFPKEDGTWMTRAEAIFATLTDAATGTDLRVKRLLFDVLVKLQRANIGCSSALYLPEIVLDDYEGDARAECDAEMEQWPERLREIEARNRAPRRAVEPASSGAEADAHLPGRSG